MKYERKIQVRAFQRLPRLRYGVREGKRARHQISCFAAVSRNLKFKHAEGIPAEQADNN